MINSNQRVSLPFGDAFAVNTSYTDKAAQQLYLEQKQREAKQEQMNAALDNEFAKNLSGIRDVDIPDLTKAYGDWKLANQQAMKQRNGVPSEQQLDVLRKKANMYKVIGESKQQKQYEDETGKGVMTNPDLYEDTAHDTLIKSSNTPLSQLGNLKGYDYRYKGTNTDFQKILATAAGQPKQVYAEEKPVDDKGLQTQITPYNYGNTPLQYYQGVLGALAQHKAGRDAAAIAAQLQPEVVKQVQEKYMQIPPESCKKMGVKEPQDLTIKPEDTPAQIYAKHEAQLYALNNEPKQGTPVFKTNEAAKLKQQQAFQAGQQAARLKHAEKMEGLRQANRVALKNYSAGKDKDNDEMVLNTFVNNTYDAGDSKISAVVIDGKQYKGRVVDIPKTIKDKYKIEYKDNTKDNEVPDDWYLTEDKKFLIPLFYTKDKDGIPDKNKQGGNYLKANSNSKPIQVQNFKVDLAKLLITQKKKGVEVIDEFDDEDTPTKPKGKFDDY